MTPNQFRKIALGMDGAIEASHMNHPDFRANGKIFATIHPDNKQGGLKLTPEQQAAFMSAHPKMFVPAPGAWGRGGATMVQFAFAETEVVGEAVTLAWQSVMAEKPRRPGNPKVLPPQKDSRKSKKKSR
ncbi:MAG: MmcQ/YjbR family DNA-binding protein [Vicinamibacterales bacterium]